MANFLSLCLKLGFLRHSCRCYGDYIEVCQCVISNAVLTGIGILTVRLRTVKLQTVSLRDRKQTSKKYMAFQTNQIRGKCNIMIRLLRRLL